jgi:hypothetical protein
LGGLRQLRVNCRYELCDERHSENVPEITNLRCQEAVMQGIRIVFGTLLLLLIAGEASQVIFQQKPVPPAQQNFNYDPANQTTLQGTIEEVKDYKCPVTGTVGSHISVKGEQTSTEIHLAPAKFMKEYEIVLKPGDAVKIVGVKIVFDGKPGMLAKSVTVGKETFIFRDDKGRPLW